MPSGSKSYLCRGEDGINTPIVSLCASRAANRLQLNCHTQQQPNSCSRIRRPTYSMHKWQYSDMQLLPNTGSSTYTRFESQGDTGDRSCPDHADGNSRRILYHDDVALLRHATCVGATAACRVALPQNPQHLCQNSYRPQLHNHPHLISTHLRLPKPRWCSAEDSPAMATGQQARSQAWCPSTSVPQALLHASHAIRCTHPSQQYPSFPAVVVPQQPMQADTCKQALASTAMHSAQPQNKAQKQQRNTRQPQQHGMHSSNVSCRPDNKPIRKGRANSNATSNTTQPAGLAHAHS